MLCEVGRAPLVQVLCSLPMSSNCLAARCLYCASQGLEEHVRVSAERKVCATVLQFALACIIVARHVSVPSLANAYAHAHL
jgi:hypothetical protein